MGLLSALNLNPKNITIVHDTAINLGVCWGGHHATDSTDNCTEHGLELLVLQITLLPVLTPMIGSLRQQIVLLSILDLK